MAPTSRLPLAIAIAGTCAFALWNPPLRDLAAHTFRADYFEHYGFAIWNGTWYAGHYMLTYSVLFPPLAALLSPVWAGAVSAVACAYLFDRIVLDRWGPGARWASIWFAALGSVAMLANGWLTFALGAALALASLRALQVGRRPLALAAAVACALASPVAAFLLALVVGVAALSTIGGTLGRGDRRPIGRREQDIRRPGAVVAAALVPVAVLSLLFPEEGGRFPFWFSAYWPLGLTCAGALLLLRGVEGERQVRWVTGAYLALGTISWLVPNPLGGNVTRLGSLFAGPVLAAILLTRDVRAPRALVAAVLGLALGWQVVTPLPDTFQSLDDPSTERSYYEPVAAWLDSHGGERARIEVPYTFNHWETAYLSPRFHLARGWLRQLDLERNELFYEGRLTPGRYLDWLRDNAIRFVALSDARLDYSAQEEADLVRAEPPFLKLRATTSHWRIYEVRGGAALVEPLGRGRARVVKLEPQAVELAVTAPGRFLVRVRGNPYWRVEEGVGCVGQSGAWTVVRADRAGPIRIGIGFSVSAAARAVSRKKRDCPVAIS